MILRVGTHLQELWDLTRSYDQRMCVHRHYASPRNDTVFTLYTIDAERVVIEEVTTKNLESGAAWILDQYRRHTLSP